MNYIGYSPAPSATFERSASIDPTKHVSYATEPTAPTISSVLNGHSEPQLTATSQHWAPPVQSDVRPIMNSTNQIRDRGLSSTSSSGQAPGLSGAVHNIMSANEVTSKVSSEAKAPTMTGVAERDRSNKGESDEAEQDNDNEQELVGVSMVGKKFKPVNPEAYDVEDDDEY
ncbi:hypothetical protein HanRHA438_Chr11g0530081 [Helianthus annuus]|uniref:Uncharacterized protein n=1 Tax=Helianthus annuus TaxID=4232 RepID=A0A9K3HU59_HELAN|nr:hypothetical protein HanXRQr2_Chr11g0518531 [Helianthus annuus]KAJ0511939.1 hypothetical protein HanIR_Chr11g0557661 [Helianthus annuus]KAJ0873001.1 hypothetical protein HanRHA438_Chr11g0530081 [Helianthus annuus]KAJ0877402.1 hypothetical protein HanPSC8_Chr11g0499721 [Helianthus annuus]